MDGNGRWAERRSRPRVWGHVRGSNRASEIIETASRAGVEALTLYAFSSENWCRPLYEIQTLFRLMDKFILREQEKVLSNNICFQVIGDISSLPHQTVLNIQKLTQMTTGASGMKLTFAFGYGGRDEIISAVNRHIKNRPGEPLNEKLLEKQLMRPEIGDVDLLIRTGGDYRISNFLLWQMAYAELFFTKTKWPDFASAEFLEILDQASMRQRRFGQITTCPSLEAAQEQAFQHKKKITQLTAVN